MTATTAPYTRGTATTRITTAALAAGGAWVLTVDADAERKALLAKHGIESAAEVTNPTGKTGTTLRQVARAEAVMHRGGNSRKAQRTYTIHFTDGSYAHGNAPATTWHLVDAPAAEEAPAAEVTAPLAVVTLDSTEATVEVAPTAATKAYRVGKVLREAVLAASAVPGSTLAELQAHVASRNVCYDGTATLRLTVATAEELSAVAAQVGGMAAAAQRTLAKLF